MNTTRNKSAFPLFEKGVRGSLLLVALFAALSLNAQVVTVYKEGKVISCAASPDSMVFTDTYPDFAASTVFAVSDTSYVHFSQGNLQYQASTDTWRFAEHQYDYIGPDNANISDTTYTGWIDLFCWGTGDDPTFVADYNNHKTTFVDWGTNVIGTDTANTWRSLTADEWQYLFQYTRWAIATVNGTVGFLLLPAHLEIYKGLKEDHVYTASDFVLLESMGVVFLPCAGGRSELRVYECGVQGYYWATTLLSETNAQYLGFRLQTAYFNKITPYFGMSVRLVKDVPFNNQ